MEILKFDNLPLSHPPLTLVGNPSGPPEVLRDYLTEAFSENTLRAYQSDLAHFHNWGGEIPSSPEVIARYIAHHAGQLKAATLGRRVIALGKAHTTQGLSNPCDSDLVRATLRGVRRAHGTFQRQARALLAPDLLLILDRLSDSPRDLRDKALLLMGFAGALRRAELVALLVNDLENVAQGMVLHLRRSKTDQEGLGRKIGLPYARGRHCPALSTRAWMQTAGISCGPVFRSVDRRGRISEASLSTQAVSKIIKERVALLGHDPKQYSGHSLRAGLATSAASAGLSTWKIRQQTGHTSDVMLQRYIRDGELFRGNVAGAIL